MEIKRIVEKLMRKYDANDPFKLAAHLNIVVQHVRLGNTWCYYVCHRWLKTIHVNCDLPKALPRYTYAYELGHAVLHKSVPMPFFKRHTLFSVQKIERQANTFAVELLMPDNLLKEYEGYPVKDIAYMAGVPKRYGSVENMKGKKYYVKRFNKFPNR